MGEFRYDIDKHFWEVYLPTSANDLVVEEDTTGDGNFDTSVILTIPSGHYFNHLSGSPVSADGRDGLLLELEQQLNNSGTLTGTYNVVAQTPTLPYKSANNQLPKSGITIKETSDSPNKFALDFLNNNTTINQRYFGFVSNLQQVEAQTVTGGSEIVSPFSVWGQWQVSNVVRNAASDKTEAEVNEHHSSTGDAPNARVQNLREFEIRKFAYPAVFGALVRRNRGHDQGSAKTAHIPWYSPGGVPLGDINNAWADFFRFMATPHRTTGRPRDAMVVHDTGDTGHTLNKSDDQIERYRLRVDGNRSNQDPSDYWDTRSATGEMYDLEWEAQILENFGYRQ